jgi:chorismate mutase
MLAANMYKNVPLVNVPDLRTEKSLIQSIRKICPNKSANIVVVIMVVTQNENSNFKFGIISEKSDITVLRFCKMQTVPNSGKNNNDHEHN